MMRNKFCSIFILMSVFSNSSVHAQMACKNLFPTQGFKVVRIEDPRTAAIIDSLSLSEGLPMSLSNRPSTSIQVDNGQYGPDKFVHDLEILKLVDPQNILKANETKYAGSINEQYAVTFAQEDVANPNKDKDKDQPPPIKVSYMTLVVIPVGNKMRFYPDPRGTNNVTTYDKNNQENPSLKIPAYKLFSNDIDPTGAKITKYFKIPTEKVFDIKTNEGTVFFKMESESGEVDSFAIGVFDGSINLFVKPSSHKTWKRITTPHEQISFDHYKKAPPEIEQVKKDSPADRNTQDSLNRAYEKFGNLKGESSRLAQISSLPDFDLVFSHPSHPELAGTTQVPALFPANLPYATSNVFMNNINGVATLHIPPASMKFDRTLQYAELTNRQYAEIVDRFALHNKDETFRNGFSVDKILFYIVDSIVDNKVISRRYCFDLNTNTQYVLRDGKWYPYFQNTVPETHLRSPRTFSTPHGREAID